MAEMAQKGHLASSLYLSMTKNEDEVSKVINKRVRPTVRKKAQPEVRVVLDWKPAKPLTAEPFGSES